MIALRERTFQAAVLHALDVVVHVDCYRHGIAASDLTLCLLDNGLDRRISVQKPVADGFAQYTTTYNLGFCSGAVAVRDLDQHVIALRHILWSELHNRNIV